MPELQQGSDPCCNPVRVAVVGGGVGGLAAAIRLRALGHDITVFERDGRVGLERDAPPELVAVEDNQTRRARVEARLRRSERVD